MERLFNLDAQLLFGTAMTAVNVFIIFLLASYFLFNPVREFLKKRENKVRDQLESAERANTEADALKQEYEEKLKLVNKEAEEILSAARKKAQQNENRIVSAAKEEAAMIIAQARNEAELEKKRVADDVKKEMIQIASVMAGKVVSAAIDTTVQESLVEETLKEIGDSTWAN